jgi:molybdenum cofactor cytidylyltransferase
VAGTLEIHLPEEGRGPLKPAGLILAGGESRRMGSPKALLELAGETFLDRLILTLGAVCAPVVVVLGHEAHEIRAGSRRADLAEFVTNAEYERGQLSSLQCGLAVLPDNCGGVMFTPVDCPAVLPSTVALLARRLQERAPGELLVVPLSDGRHGHPVGMAPELIPEFLALPLEAQARDVIRRHRERTVYVDVNDPGVWEDVDDPESYERMLARLGRS